MLFTRTMRQHSKLDAITTHRALLKCMSASKCGRICKFSIYENLKRATRRKFSYNASAFWKAENCGIRKFNKLIINTEKIGIHMRWATYVHAVVCVCAWKIKQKHFNKWNVDEVADSSANKQPRVARFRFASIFISF